MIATRRCSERPEGQRAADPWRSLVSCAAYYQWRVFKEKVLSKDREQTLQPVQSPSNRPLRRHRRGELYWEQPGRKPGNRVVGPLLDLHWTVVPKILGRTSQGPVLNPRPTTLGWPAHEDKSGPFNPRLEPRRIVVGPHRGLPGFRHRHGLGESGRRFGRAAKPSPDIEIRWNRVTLRLTTHEAGGLTEQDWSWAETANDVLQLRGTSDGAGR